jgi:hypothetical protein
MLRAKISLARGVIVVLCQDPRSSRRLLDSRLIAVHGRRRQLPHDLGCKFRPAPTSTLIGCSSRRRLCMVANWLSSRATGHEVSLPRGHSPTGRNALGSRKFRSLTGNFLPCMGLTFSRGVPDACRQARAAGEDRPIFLNPPFCRVCGGTGRKPQPNPPGEEAVRSPSFRWLIVVASSILGSHDLLSRAGDG